MNIYKTEAGAPGKQKVVVLHGWGCDHRHMQPIVDALSDRYHVYNYDLPGRGKSEWDANIKSIDDFVDALLSHLPETAIYVGWSFGGLISMLIAARYPERVERFIGIGTTPRFIASDNWIGFPQPGFKVPFQQGIDELGFMKFMEAYIDNEFQDIAPLPPGHQELYDILHNSSEVDLDILYDGINICDSTDLRKSFAQINCPIKFIWGGADDCVPNESHDNILKLNSYAHADVIEGAHHMMFWTHQKEFNGILNKLMKN